MIELCMWTVRPTLWCVIFLNRFKRIKYTEPICICICICYEVSKYLASWVLWSVIVDGPAPTPKSQVATQEYDWCGWQGNHANPALMWSTSPHPPTANNNLSLLPKCLPCHIGRAYWTPRVSFHQSVTPDSRWPQHYHSLLPDCLFWLITRTQLRKWLKKTTNSHPIENHHFL